MPTEPTAAEPRAIWAEPNAVRLHVVIAGIDPPVWRRLVVPLHFTLAQLHPILQAAFGWTDSHLHQFLIGGLRYGEADLLNQDMLDDDDRRKVMAERASLGHGRLLSESLEIVRTSKSPQGSQQ